MEELIDSLSCASHVKVKNELSSTGYNEQHPTVRGDGYFKHHEDVEGYVKVENELSNEDMISSLQCSTKLTSGKKSSKKVYKCEDCGFMSKKIRQMQRHFRVHEPDKPHQCDICKKSFNKLGVMKRHRLSHTAQKHYLCDLCGRSYTQIMSFKYHKLSHMKFLDDKKNDDELATSEIKENLNDNELPKNKFLCDLCGKFFKQAITLKVHKKWHENKKDCMPNINKKDGTEKRKLAKARVMNGATSRRKSFKCSECPFMATRSRDVLSHMYVHTGKKPFSCQICKRWFSKPNTLKRHILLHNNQMSRVNNYTPNKDVRNCTGDGYHQLPQIVTIQPNESQVDESNSSLISNNLVTNVAPTILKIQLLKPNDVCNTKLNSKMPKVEVVKNIKVKSVGRKRYYCDECPYSSHSSRDLKVHKRRHTGEKPYACTVCDKTFANRSVAKRHVLTVHSEERAHKCNICGKGYTQASNLKMHKLTHYDIATGELHNQNKQPTVGRPKGEIIFNNMEEATSCLEAIVSQTINNKYIHNTSTSKYTKSSKRKKEKKEDKCVISQQTEMPSKNEISSQDCGLVNDEVKNVIESFDDNSHFEDFTMNNDDHSHDEVENTNGFDIKDESNSDSDKLTKLIETCDNLKVEISDDLINYENPEIKVEPIYDIDNVNKQFDDSDDLPLIFQRNQVDLIIKKEDDRKKSTKDKAMRKLLKKQKKEKIKIKREKLKDVIKAGVVESNSNQIMLQCNLCHYTVAKKRDLERHMRSHSKEKPYECDICKRHFSDQSVVKRHKLIHLGIKRFSCQFCDKKFSQSTGLKAHMLHHTGAPPILPYICDLCGNTFSQEKSLKAHRHVHFRGNSSTQYTCSDCGKSFSFECRLKEHQLTHNGERTVPCDLCDKKFLRVKDMRSHRLLHTRKQKSVCDKCGKLFATPKTLRLHTQCHSLEKPYVCHICGTAFSRQSHLTRHTLTHTGVKTFGCSVCNKWFTQRSALNRHKFLHTNDTPYSCSVCSKRFKMLDNLKKHIKRTKQCTGSLLNKNVTDSFTNHEGQLHNNSSIQIQSLPQPEIKVLAPFNG